MMFNPIFRRRTLLSLKNAAGFFIAGHQMLNHVAQAEKTVDTIGMQVPYSAGRGVPQIKMPMNACDCHHHIYDPVLYPYVPEDIRNQPPATVDAYKLLQQRLGLTRNVIVQPSAYGTDNSCTLAALKSMGASARAVVVLDQKVTSNSLEQMHNQGVRAIRFNISTGATKNTNDIRNLASKVNEFGWHIQFWMSAEDTVELAPFLEKLPNQLVFDHRGHLPQPEGISHPAFNVISKLLEKEKAWVKLSGLYIDSKVFAPSYQDTVAVGKAFVELAPDRMVWGTDWPHPSVFSERQAWPDDAHMLSLLEMQAGDEKIRKKILVTNPEKLYGF